MASKELVVATSQLLALALSQAKPTLIYVLHHGACALMEGKWK